jgi:DinB superfamily
MHKMQTTIDALASFPEKVGNLFGCFTRELAVWTPSSWDGIPSEKLTAVEQICHIRDIEIEGYRVRFDRARFEVRPVLADMPGETMALERNYSAQDPIAALGDFTTARAMTVDTMRNFSDEDLARIAIFEGRPTTVAGLIHFLGSHDYQHLAGLQWLLARHEQELSQC